ncbi:hypothetical protein ENTKAS01_46110 [Enterobacter sp. AS-1]|nr:hypothetical protein ENTKAS01_46110 [Enterobacter sp. AS-1]
MVKKFDVKFKCIADGINFSKSIGNNMGCGENLLLLTIIETKRSCFERGLRSNGTETYDNGINMLYLKCFYLGLTLSGTKTYVKV